MLPLHVQRRLEIKAIKKLSIVDFLNSIVINGKPIEPVRISGNKAYYLSPLREEKHPSFVVYLDKNDWYDYGINKGGSIIDLVMEMFNMKYTEAVQMLRISLKNKVYPSVNTDTPNIDVEEDAANKTDINDKQRGKVSFEVRQTEKFEDKPLPYIHNGELIIPFNSDSKYHWWKEGGQSVMETLKEIKAPREVVKKYTW